MGDRDETLLTNRKSSSSACQRHQKWHFRGTLLLHLAQRHHARNTSLYTHYDTTTASSRKEQKESHTRQLFFYCEHFKLQVTQKEGLRRPAVTFKPSACCLLQLNQSRRKKEQFGQRPSNRISAHMLAFRLLCGNGSRAQTDGGKERLHRFFSETWPDCPERWQSSGPRVPTLSSLANKISNVNGGGHDTTWHLQECRSLPRSRERQLRALVFGTAEDQNIGPVTASQAWGKEKGSRDATHEIPSSPPLLSSHDVVRKRP